jgi:hypothetical protein
MSSLKNFVVMHNIAEYPIQAETSAHLMQKSKIFFCLLISLFQELELKLGKKLNEKKQT